MNSRTLAKRAWKWPILMILVFGALIAGGRIFYEKWRQSGSISNFEECAAAGNPILESFPEQCIANGRTFVNTPKVR